MKKTLLAAALLTGFAGAAQANSVTLYGLVDIGYQYQKARGESAINALESGQQSTSHFGLKGVEDLGNSLYGSFKLEAGFSSDTGASEDGGLFNRESWLGVGNAAWGEVRFGKQRTITGDYADAIDPFHNDFGLAGFSNVAIANGTTAGNILRSAPVAISKGGHFVAGTSFQSGAETLEYTDLSRQNNTIKYLSPNWNGFEFGANYSFNTQAQEVAGNSNNDTGYGVALRYVQPQWQLMVSYDRFNNGDAGVKDADNGYTQAWQIAGTYDFGEQLANIKLHAAYANNDYDFGNGRMVTSTRSTATGIVDTLIGSEDEDVYMIGLSAPVGNGELFGSYYATSASYLRGAEVGTGIRTYTENGALVGAAQEKAKASSWQVGYTYNLSKRTNVYSYFAQSQNVTTRTDDNEKSRVRQFGLGVRHSF